MLPNPNWTDKQHLTGLSKLSGKCAVPCWEPADLYSLSVFSLLLFRFTARHGAPAPRPEEHVTLSVCYTAENRAAEWKMNWTTQSTAAASYLGWEKWNWKYSSLQSSACLCCWLANRGRKWVKQIDPRKGDKIVSWFWEIPTYDILPEELTDTVAVP